MVRQKTSRLLKKDGFGFSIQKGSPPSAELVFICVSPGRYHKAVMGRRMTVADKYGGQHIYISHVKTFQFNDFYGFSIPHDVGGKTHRCLPGPML